jgi:hypothetical protein
MKLLSPTRVISYRLNLQTSTYTQFFTDWNNIRTGVRSYILDKKNGFWGLVHLPNYVKELCDVHSVAAQIRRDLDFDHVYGPPPVTFILCHGGKRFEKEPAFLNFGEQRHDDDQNGTTNRVWACKPENEQQLLHQIYWDAQVVLQDLIRQSKMVVLMCCNGDQIVEDYVLEMTTSQMTNEIPDILFFNCADVNKTTHIILLALLRNLIDSDDQFPYDPPAEELYSAVKRSIITILKIVKWCTDNINMFWDFLLHMGVVSTYESEKKKQGLPIAKERFDGKDWTHHYRVSGHIFHDYIPDIHKKIIFNEFQALTLISAWDGKPIYQNCDSVEPLPSDDSDSSLRDVLFKYLGSLRPLSQDTLVSACINNIYIV